MDVNTPEIGEDGYEEAKEFVNKTCLDEAVKLDVDDMEQYDPHYRILAVVYVNETNLNEKMVREGYAEVMYFPQYAILQIYRSYMKLSTDAFNFKTIEYLNNHKIQ